MIDLDKLASDPMTEYEKIVCRENNALRIENADLRRRLKQAETDRDINEELADRYLEQRDSYFNQLVDLKTKTELYRNEVENYFTEIIKLLKER